MRKHLYVDNTDLATFGVYCSGQGTFGAPEKDVTTYTVPGRDGLVLGVNERLENIQVVYPCFIYANFAQNLRNLRSFLLSRSGYVKINDDYDTTHFRMGFFEAGIDPEVMAKNNAGRFNLVFNCQPQRWLNSGETVISGITAGTSSSTFYEITNPTLFKAKPLIRIYLSGGRTVYFYEKKAVLVYSEIARIVIDSSLSSSTYRYVEIDCDKMSCLSPRGVNLSGYVEFKTSLVQHYDAPWFVPGINAIGGAGSTDSVLDIVPRWWEV